MLLIRAYTSMQSFLVPPGRPGAARLLPSPPLMGSFPAQSPPLPLPPARLHRLPPAPQLICSFLPAGIMSTVALGMINVGELALNSRLSTGGRP